MVPNPTTETRGPDRPSWRYCMPQRLLRDCANSTVMKSSPLLIGGLVFNGMDQADFTGPFEVLSRVPDSEFLVASRFTSPIRDARGLVLTPQVSFIQTPKLDVLLVPGGSGVN